MRVWLDDRRPAPADWVWVKTPEEAIELLATGQVEEISLDHDLGLLDGEREQTGYDVVVWMEEQVVTAGFVPPEVIKVHSSNSSAAPKMERGVASIRRLAKRAGSVKVRLEPWSEDDFPLLKKLLGDPAMTGHLGGPESDEKLAERQARFEQVADSGSGRVLKIVDVATGEGVGQVAYWTKDWRGEPIYEIGWLVLPAFQGRGIASAATSQAIAIAATEGKHRFLHAFPSVENGPSNAMCRKLGFTLIEECEFEYPPGQYMRCNDWQLDLTT